MSGIESNIMPLVSTVGFGGIVGFLIGFALKRIMKILAVIAGVFLLHLCIWSCVASILHQYFAGEYNNGKSLDIFDAKQKIIFKIPFL